MNQIRVLQWNVQKSKTGAMIPLLHGDTPDYDIIAVQEPWLNPQLQTSYCPRSCQYDLAFPTEGRARTCILINKRLLPNRWMTGTSPDYCWIRIEIETEPMTIHNIYSETPPSYQTRNWNTPIPQLRDALQQPGQHLIVGDFNLHHGQVEIAQEQEPRLNCKELRKELKYRCGPPFINNVEGDKQLVVARATP